MPASPVTPRSTERGRRITSRSSPSCGIDRNLGPDPRSILVVTALYVAAIVIGVGLCVVSVVWTVRTRHERHVWRRTRHDTSTAAIVLELEERVREVEQHARPPVDVR